MVNETQELVCERRLLEHSLSVFVERQTEKENSVYFSQLKATRNGSEVL